MAEKPRAHVGMSTRKVVDPLGMNHEARPRASPRDAFVAEPTFTNSGIENRSIHVEKSFASLSISALAQIAVLPLCLEKNRLAFHVSRSHHIPQEGHLETKSDGRGALAAADAAG